MKITHQTDKDTITVYPEGKIDSLSAAEFEQYLDQFREEENNNLEIDCRSLEYISSAGLRVLLVNAKRAQQQSRLLTLRNLNDNVKQVLDLTGFTTLFSIV